MCVYVYVRRRVRLALIELSGVYYTRPVCHGGGGSGGAEKILILRVYVCVCVCVCVSMCMVERNFPGDEAGRRELVTEDRASVLIVPLLRRFFMVGLMFVDL